MEALNPSHPLHHRPKPLDPHHTHLHIRINKAHFGHHIHNLVAELHLSYLQLHKLGTIILRIIRVKCFINFIGRLVKYTNKNII